MSTIGTTTLVKSLTDVQIICVEIGAKQDQQMICGKIGAKQYDQQVR